MLTTSIASVFNFQPSNRSLNVMSKPNEIHTQELCKFCFQTERQSHQKLISPCGCLGSLKYVHKQCLQKWLIIEADKKEGPLADISFKLKNPNLKCKLCSKEIVFQNQIKFISQLITFLHLITIFCSIKKLKYYACISILGSLAINYYFMRYLFGKLYKASLKIKDHSWIFLVAMSIILVLLEQTFIEVKWNRDNMEFSIPYLHNK